MYALFTPSLNVFVIFCCEEIVVIAQASHRIQLSVSACE